MPPLDNSVFGVNIGDALEHLSGGAFRATPHRVRMRDPVGGAGRIFVPYFYDPSMESQMVSASTRPRGCSAEESQL